MGFAMRGGWSAASLFFGSSRRGARTIVQLADSPEAAAASGQYFSEGQPQAVVGQAADDFFAAELWRRSAELVGVG